jgi:hypothetical protein
MIKRERRYLPVCLLALLLWSSFGQLLHGQEYKYEIGGAAGGAFYMGDANKTALFREMRPALGAVFRNNINFRWAIKSNLYWGQVAGDTESNSYAFPNDLHTAFSRNVFDLGSQAEFNFFPYSDKFPFLNTKRISPYMLVGLGVTLATGGDNAFFSVNLPMGVGVKYKIVNRLNVGCEFTLRKVFGDSFDSKALNDPMGVKSSFFKNKDWYSTLLLSLTWDFGPRDRVCLNDE